MTLLLSLACATTPAPPPEAAASASPSAAEILDRFVEVTNGDTQGRYSAWASDGTMSLPAMGLEARVQSWAQAPDNSLTVVDMAGIGEMWSGFDGETAWTLDPLSGPAVLTGDDRDQSAFFAHFAGYDDWRERFETPELVGSADQDGVETWQLQLVPHVGPRVLAGFAKDTGLLRSLQMEVSTPMGVIESSMLLDGYREFDGVLSATLTYVETLGMQQIFTIDSLVFDPPELPSFVPPDPIQAILAEQATEGGSSPTP